MFLFILFFFFSKFYIQKIIYVKIYFNKILHWLICLCGSYVILISFVSDDLAKRLTPGMSNSSRSPLHGNGDRFIPNRSAMQFDLGHYMVFSSNIFKICLFWQIKSSLKF